jgi:hypothetical protein
VALRGITPRTDSIQRGMNWKRTTIASLLLSFGLFSAAQAQDREHHDRDDDNRVYDSYHSDYHQWTPQEDGYYRRWYSTTYQGRDYREYRRLDRDDQRNYWNWRHAHHEHEEHEEHEHDRDHR